jgi:predicted amidohydrolase YtcJ
MFARVLVICIGAACSLPAAAAEPDLILHHGKIVTVDPEFSIRSAISITADRITAVGSDGDILASRGPKTTIVDLQGKMVLPGLIDCHLHAYQAAVSEFDHRIADMETVRDVLDYVKARADVLEDGQWVYLRQVFITRLKEQRYPTRAELDEVAPKNPVLFATGPDASVNSLALKLSGIDGNFKPTDGGPGFVEKNPATGEPTGILRSLTRYIKYQPSTRAPTPEEHRQCLVKLFKDYNSVGLTTISERGANAAILEDYTNLRDAGRLSLRIFPQYHVETIGDLDKMLDQIRAVAKHPLRRPDPMLQIVGIKTLLDGGMLTGSALMREPWGVSSIYAITDPEYRGTRLIEQDRLVALVRTTVENGLQFNSHCVGDGAVHAMLDAYREVNKSVPIGPTRPCIAHANFQSPEAIDQVKALGVVLDMQPAWLYLDTRTLEAQFGYDRLRWFQPLRSVFEAGIIAGGGSDHMQKLGSLRSANPYNPFLAISTAITRRARWYPGQLHPEEALAREQAIRFYTTNNAFILFRENQIGSLEPGKLADLVVLDRDLLTCEVDQIKDTRVLATYLGGKSIFAAQ